MASTVMAHKTYTQHRRAVARFVRRLWHRCFGRGIKLVLFGYGSRFVATCGGGVASSRHRAWPCPTGGSVIVDTLADGEGDRRGH